MSWESLEAVAAVVAAGAAVFAIWLQNKSFKANLTADLAIKLDDRFSSAEVKESRSRAARALKAHIAEKEAEDAFDFFETIGLFVRRKALDEEIVHSLFFHWINLYWTAGKDHIRRRQRETKNLWRDFESLYKKVLEIEREENPNSPDITLSLFPDKLAQYLDEEIELANPSDSQTSADRR
jgi:hypothetical protein